MSITRLSLSHWLALFVLVLCPSLAVGQQRTPLRSPAQLAEAIDAVLDKDAFANAFWGVYVADLNTGEVLYNRNGRKSFMPASNVKLYTAAVALMKLGPDYRYRTTLYADGPVHDGVLRGDLIIRGSGDPTIGGRFHDGDVTRVFRAWADSLINLGITRIEGDIIGDDDIFDDIPLGTGWSWDDETYYYASEISGLSFNENVIDVSIRGQRIGAPGSVTWEPFNTSYVAITNETITVASQRPLEEGYERTRGTNHIRLYSEVPAGRTDKESLSVHGATLYFAHVLSETLVQAGISVAGQPIDIDDLPVIPNYADPGLRPVASYESPPLAEIVREMGVESNNHIAEQLLKTLAAAVPLSSRAYDPGSAEMGVAIVREQLGRIGVDTTRINLVDGSGLSRKDLVTPEATGILLQHMWDYPDRSIRNAFHDALPVGGVSGTLEYRFQNAPLRGNVRAKTGSLGGVSSLSGYVRTSSQTPLVFVIMANHFTSSSYTVRNAQDAIVALLAQYRG